MSKIRIAIVGVGNCASSLVQGIHFYGDEGAGAGAETASGTAGTPVGKPLGQPIGEPIGLMHREIGGYRPGDIEVAAAFDIDRRKVGRDVAEAIFALPNCTTVFCERVPAAGVVVSMGRVLDGYSDHMGGYADARTFLKADLPEPDAAAVVRELRRGGAEIVVNYLPVGSEEATRFYAECALAAGCGFVNNIPVFIASDPAWARRFEAAGLPLVGDDIKAQLGATITHRALMDLFARRGVTVDRTYQLNTGGNTDFLNMLSRDRLASKKTSKTEAVQSAAPRRLDDDDIHIGPSDYVPWQKDNKVCFLRIEGRLFGEVPLSLELRLSVEDSPNSAGVAIDSIRCCRLALDRGQGGVLGGPSSFFCKHPPRQRSDEEAWRLTEDFIAGVERDDEADSPGLVRAGAAKA